MKSKEREREIERERLTFRLIGKEVVNLRYSSVVGTHNEAMVVHVQNYILTLCMGMGVWKYVSTRVRKYRIV